MTTNHEHLREVAERATPIYTDLLGDRYFNDDYSHATLNVQQDDFISTFNPATVKSLLDELAALRKENEGLKAALEVEQVDLEFTIQAIVADDPKDEIHLRVRDQKRRVTTALNAARAAIGDSHE